MWGVKRAERAEAGIGKSPTNELCYKEEQVQELRHIMRTEDVSMFMYLFLQGHVWCGK